MPTRKQSTAGSPRSGTSRQNAIRDRLNAAAREHSTATVLFHQAMAARQGLSASEGKTLDYLSRLGPLTPGQLASHSGLAPASVTELVDRLEARGFVERRRDQEDRRRVLVQLVPERLRELSAAYDRFGDSTAVLWERFTRAELEVIERFLVNAAAFMRDATARLDAD